MKKIILLSIIFYNSMSQVFSQELRNSDKFAFSMLKNLEKKENTFLSPYSIRTILSLCAEGAKGATLEEMQKTLSLESDATKRQKEMQVTIQKISDAKDFKLVTTNMLWIEKSMEVLDAYKKIAKDFYMAGAEVLGFKENPEKARQRINLFVEEKTNKMIKNLLPVGVVDKETKMVLTNTIYFKADWKYSFDKKYTQKLDFKVNGEKDEKVDMMYQNNFFKAGILDGNSVIQLPYKGNKVSMWVILPKDKKLPELLKNIDANLWTALKNAVSKKDVRLYLPVFEFETKYMLSNNLKAMGMPTAFGDVAQFSGISQKTSLKISEVIHQAKVKVEEKGTEAAAATAVVMTPKSSSHQSELQVPFIFKADHPFLFVIEHTETQEILFIGTVQKPIK
ncbi:MAG: serpin family protein [Raineya sp.]|jgi:serpin B|nr:serpin family protein [Raineya sp.]